MLMASLRYDGVISFLASRGIALPLDAPPEAPDARSCTGWERKKTTTSSMNCVSGA